MRSASIQNLRVAQVAAGSPVFTPVAGVAELHQMASVLVAAYVKVELVRNRPG